MRLPRIVSLLAASVSLAAQAAVTPLNGPNSNVFLDAANGLLWSQPDAFAANNFASAEAAVSAATIEDLSDWYLPSLEQFRSLYRTQGTASTGDTRPEYDEIMVESPFSGMLPTWYWTTDVFPDVNLQNYGFSPTDENTQPYFRTTRVNVWAVHDYRAAPVPEPGLMALAAVALLVMIRLVRRARRKR